MLVHVFSAPADWVGLDTSFIVLGIHDIARRFEWEKGHLMLLWTLFVHSVIRHSHLREG